MARKREVVPETGTHVIETEGMSEDYTPPSAALIEAKYCSVPNCGRAPTGERCAQHRGWP